MTTLDELKTRIAMHYPMSVDYLHKVLDDDYVIVSGNWEAYFMVEEDPGLAAALPRGYPEQMVELHRGWEEMITRCERRAYDANPLANERNFPWFEHLDLQGNLQKTLTVREMAEAGARGTYLPLSRSEKGRIHTRVLQCIFGNSRPIYERKIELERKLLSVFLSDF